MNHNRGKLSIIVTEKGNIYRNLWIANLAFAVLFGGLLSPSILQVYLTTAMRTVGFTLYFGFSVLGSLLVAPLLLNMKGCKFSAMLGMSVYFLWTLSSLYPNWITIMPTLLLSGMIYCSLFSGQLRYLSRKSFVISKYTKEEYHDVVSSIFGLSFSLLFIGGSLGCIFTGAILTHHYSVFNKDIPVNSTLRLEREKADFCGINYCPNRDMEQYLYSIVHFNNHSDGLIPVSMSPKEEEESLFGNTSVYILVSTYSAMIAIAFSLIGFFIENDTPNDSGLAVVKKSIIDMVAHLKRERQILLAPLNIYAGFSLCFTLLDYNQGYIQCVHGEDHMSYVLAFWSVSCSVSACTAGLLVKRTGRIPLFTMVFVTRLVTTLFLRFLHNPDPDETGLSYLVAIIWGLSDGFLTSQINIMYATIFPDSMEEALISYRFYESIGMFLCFFFGGLTCVGFRVYMGLGLLVISIISYYLFEVAQNIRNKREIGDMLCYETKYDFKEFSSPTENRNVVRDQEADTPCRETVL